MNKLNVNVLVQNGVVNELNNKFRKLNLNMSARMYNDYICVTVGSVAKGEIDFHENNLYIPKGIWKKRDMEHVYGYVFSRV